MRVPSLSVFAGLAIALLAIPLWASPNTGRMDKAQWSPSQESKIGAKDFAPGDYQLTAPETGNQMSVYQNGKMVAEIPCHWIQLPRKAVHTAIVTDNNDVTQVQFQGRTEAIQIR